MQTWCRFHDQNSCHTFADLTSIGMRGFFNAERNGSNIEICLRLIVCVCYPDVAYHRIQCFTSSQERYVERHTVENARIGTSKNQFPALPQFARSIWAVRHFAVGEHLSGWEVGGARGARG